MLKQIFKKIVTTILAYEAKLVLRKYRPKIIVVIGSVGKTSTKDAIFTAVGEALVARKNTKSFNGELGISLTVLNCPSGLSNTFVWLKNMTKGVVLLVTNVHYPKWLILEVGSDGPGEIAQLATWITPDIVVATRFGVVPVHVEFFKSPEEVFEEKANMVKALRPTGMLIVNADDEKVLALRDKTKAKSIKYGMSEDAMFRISNIALEYENDKPVGTTFKLEYDGNVFPVTMNGVLGEQSVYSAVASLALGTYLKINIVDMIGRLSAHKSPAGRMRIIPAIKGATIIDDTYNSSPVASESAIKVLKDIKTKGKKIAVFGDMLELGKFTIDEHKKIGALLGGFVDILLAVGPRAKYIIEGAIENDMSEKNIIEFEDSRTAGKYLESVIGEGDMILIKGSQSMRMERAVLEIMANPEKSKELLVRQEDEWQDK